MFFGLFAYGCLWDTLWKIMATSTRLPNHFSKKWCVSEMFARACILRDLNVFVCCVCVRLCVRVCVRLFLCARGCACVCDRVCVSCVWDATLGRDTATRRRNLRLRVCVWVRVWGGYAYQRACVCLFVCQWVRLLVCACVCACSLPCLCV